MIRTYWNYQPAPARVVTVIVGSLPAEMFPNAWWRGLEGTERKAVEVKYHHQTFFLDNEDGTGWAKVTGGKGSPWLGHRSLPDTSTVITDSA